MQRKNVILIVMDTARKRNISAYGYERDTTPFLNELSQNSLRFNNAVSQAPWTLPSHASMFTGKYPSEHGATQEQPYLDETQTLAKTLSENGYSTGLFSANAWISPHTGLTQGFDETSNFFGPLPSRFESKLSSLWKRFNNSDRLRPVASQVVRIGNKIYEYTSSGEHDSYTPQAFSKTRDFIKNSDSPFFTCVNLLDPHLPYNPPLENLQEFGDYSRHPEICQNSKEFNSGATEITEEHWSQIRDMYDAELNYLDEQIREFYNWLKGEGLDDDTLVIICSDHGELLGEHDLYGHEFAIYDHLINVPLIINRPDGKSKVVDDTVELIDLYHTILGFTGVDDSQVESNRDIFSDTYRQEQTDSLLFPDTGFSEYSRPVIELKQLTSKASEAGITIEENSRFKSRMYAARNQSYKYIKNEKIPDELFNISEDEGENNNVIESRSGDGIKETISSNPRVGSVGSEEQPGIDAVDDSIKDRLGDLGYLE